MCSLFLFSFIYHTVSEIPSFIGFIFIYHPTPATVLHKCCATHVKIRWHFVVVSPFSPPYGFWEWNLGHQARGKHILTHVLWSSCLFLYCCVVGGGENPSLFICFDCFKVLNILNFPGWYEDGGPGTNLCWIKSWEWHYWLAWQMFNFRSNCQTVF